MRILYTVQRYGDDIVGGSEAACRMFAEQLAAAGHDVEVVTSCARRYIDWANEYARGTALVNGVTVHRLPVSRPRTNETFGPLNEWTIAGPHPMPLFQQDRWMRRMGPELDGYARWLRANAERFDVVIHMTYLYRTTTLGLPLLAGTVPTILQPTAHNEPAIWVRRYDTLFRAADSFLYFTPEEETFVRRRFGVGRPGEVVGIGIDLHDRADPAAFRAAHGIGEHPYLLYLGRIDPMKGAVQAWEYFVEYQRRRASDLKLVLVGDPVLRLAEHPDVIHVGYVDEAIKRAALAGSVALFQPSSFESFSIVLCEAWVQGRPTLVQGMSDVLTGQARRSGGAIPYRSYADFEVAVDRLLGDPALADALGARGRAYVADQYAWPAVVAKVEHQIEVARGEFATRRRGVPVGSAGRHLDPDSENV